MAIKKPLTFYDVKAGKKLTGITNYRIVEKKTKGGIRTFAVAKSPKTGIEMWRIVSKGFKG